MDRTDYVSELPEQRAAVHPVAAGGSAASIPCYPGNISIKSRETTVSQDFTGEACQGNEGASAV